VALAEREPFLRFVEASDRAGKLTALGDLARRYIPRANPMGVVFAAAAAGDPEIAEAWEEYERRRRADTRVLVASLEPWLRDGLDGEAATDILWGAFSDATIDALVRRRGWTLDRYVDFFVDAVERLLLR
jgi:hypothetical protein